MSVGRSIACAVGLNGKLYVFGGLGECSDSKGESKILDSVECYDPQTDKWTTLPPLPTSVYGASASVL